MKEWCEMTLREAGVSLMDCDHRTPPPANTGYPYIAIPQLKLGHLDLSDVRRITQENYEAWTRKAKPQQHDVILSRRCNPGETAVVPKGLECALGQNLVLLRADGTKLFPPFLRWLARGNEWWEQVGTFINVGAVFESLRCADIPKFSFSIPPLPEQRAIASMLGALDDKIELNRRMNETLEALAQTLFKSWFVDPTPNGLPKGWHLQTIAEIASRIAMGPFGSRITRDNFMPSGVPVVRGNNLADGFYDSNFVFLTEAKAEELKSAIAHPKDIVFTHRGTLGQVGIIPILAKYPRYVVSQSQMLLSVDQKKVSAWSVYLFFRSQHGQAALLANTSTTGVPAIARPTTSLKSIAISVPPKELSDEFDKLVEPLFIRREQNTLENESLAALRDALLPKLLSGELRVRAAAQPVGTYR